MYKKYRNTLLSFFLSCSCLNAETPSLMESEIEHVVILMLENRSFDNIIAWLYDHENPPNVFIPDHTDPTFLGLTEDTLPLYTNYVKNKAGKIIFSSPPIKGTPSTDESVFYSSPKYNPNEAFPDVSRQILGFDSQNDPLMSGFLQDYASFWDEHEWLTQTQDICAVMETHTDQELPVMYTLGRHFAVSDLWFSSVPTQTNPNRAFTFCGTSEGEVVNGWLGRDTFKSDTLWNRLSEASPEISWSIFWYTDALPGIVKGPYSGPNTFAAMERIPNVMDHFLTMDYFHEQARSGTLPTVSFIEPHWTLCINLNPKDDEPTERNLIEKRTHTRNDDFWAGIQGNDYHPPGDIRGGETLLANIYTSLSANPDAWKKTLLVITFDEHGGLYDHIAPPAAISPDDFHQHGFKFDRMGVRVPTLFISPRIPEGTVIRSDDPNIPFDHTSLIATVLKWKGIDKSKWKLGHRTDAAPTFENVIQLKEPRTNTVLTTNHVELPQKDPKTAVSMDSEVCLKNKDDKYIVKNLIPYHQMGTAGPESRKVHLQFAGGGGKVTHGSFVYVKSLDPALGDENLLENIVITGNCQFQDNHHQVGQWWTIQSVDNPYLGAEIHFGDKVYLESHLFINPLQFVPARLTVSNLFFGKFLMTRPITDENADQDYWIVEKP